MRSIKQTQWSRLRNCLPFQRTVQIELRMYDRFWSLEVTTNSTFRDTTRLMNIKASNVNNLKVAQIVGIPRLSWIPKVNYRLHNGPSLSSVIFQMYPVHTIILFFLTIHLNIILTSGVCLPSGLLASGYLISILYLICYICATSLTYSCFADLNNRR